MSTHPKSSIQNLSSTSIRDPKSKIANHKLEYGFRVASYDKSHDLIIDPLLASTYLGGTSRDDANAIAIDASGNVYVTGETSSLNFPTTSDAYNTALHVDEFYYDNRFYFDAFVSKLDSSLSSLLASTYLGGTSNDEAKAIAVDASGNVYVTGQTSSSDSRTQNTLDFPTTIGAYDISFNGGDHDVFVSKLDGSLSSLYASTFLGGSDEELSYAMTLDASGNVYVTGTTASSDFPTTCGAYDTSFNSSDRGVTKGRILNLK